MESLVAADGIVVYEELVLEVEGPARAMGKTYSKLPWGG